jgi:acyl carrier protein
LNEHLDSRIPQIFADVFGVPVESIRPDTSPETIETWDSLQHLNLVLALEQEFSVQFAPEEIETLLSPEKVMAVVAEKIREMEASQCL